MPESRPSRFRHAAGPGDTQPIHAAMSDPPLPLQDRILYPGGAWEHSHPDRIAANARMYGLDTTPVERCRVLELGCGAGGNLIPMAYGLPEARFVGIELASRPVEHGRRLATSLELSNIDLLQRDIQDLPADLGEFDYIIAHGVYSWVAGPERDALMSAFARHLAPAGIAYLNFNAYPGGHLRALARDMMRFRLAVHDEPSAHVEDALRYLRLVARAQPEEATYRRVLEEELGRLERTPVSVLLHDDLLPAQQAFHFRHVVEHAVRHGLEYLCEARPADVHPHRYPEPVRAALRRFGGDRVSREQCFDFLVCQAYRSSLFYRKGMSLAPLANIDGMQGLRAASSLLPAKGAVDLTDGIAMNFRAPDGGDHADRRLGSQGGPRDPRRALARECRGRAAASRCAPARRARRASNTAGATRIRLVSGLAPCPWIRRSPHMGTPDDVDGERSARGQRTRPRRDRPRRSGHQPAPSSGRN